MRAAIPLAFAAVLAAAAPALAVPVCNGGSSDTFSSGSATFTEAENNEFALNTLRGYGVNARRVERWSGCLRVYVWQSDGSEVVQYYDPQSYRRVE